LSIPDELRGATNFHTHLGPFLVVGLRMGAVVTRELGSEPFSIHIVAHTGRRPPYSCVLDGIQFSTPCTVGNGGLEVGDDRLMTIDAAAHGRRVTAALRDDVFWRIENECTKENQERFACNLWTLPEEELLHVTVVSEERASR